MIRYMAVCAAALTVAFAAGAAEAQKPGASTAMPPAVNDGEAYHRADDSQQDPAELRTTQALNDEIVSRNQLADNQDRADQAAYEAERAKYEDTVARATEAQLTYEEDVRRHEAEQRRWQAERDRWEADVRACEGGDRSRCAAPRG